MNNPSKRTREFGSFSKEPRVPKTLTADDLEGAGENRMAWSARVNPPLANTCSFERQPTERCW